MVNIRKSVTAALLAAAVLAGQAGTAELFSVSASAAYVNDLKINGPDQVTISGDQATEFTYYFSGEGIKSIQQSASDNLSLNMVDIHWDSYPNECYVIYSVRSWDGKGGEVKFWLNDADGNNVKSVTTKVKVAGETDSAAEVKFKDMSFPASITKGKGQHIKGTVTSTEKIDGIQAVVYDSKNKAVMKASVKPGKKTYKLYDSDLDWDLSFGKLGAGEYTLCYYVASGSTDTSYKHKFTVKGSSSEAKVTFSGMSFPENIGVGKGQHIKGTVKASASIKKIQAVIRDSSGKEVKSAAVKPGKKSYKLYDSDLDWKLPFASLSAGEYTLTYKVTAGSTTKSYTHKFSVGGKNSGKKDDKTNAKMEDAISWMVEREGWKKADFGYKWEWCTAAVSDAMKNSGYKICRTLNPCDFVIDVCGEHDMGTFYCFRAENLKSLKSNGMSKSGLKHVKSVSRDDITPQRGDIVIYRWSDDNGYNWSHIGIVTGYSKGEIYTIEGNTSGGKMAKRTRSYNSEVVGILRM